MRPVGGRRPAESSWARAGPTRVVPTFRDVATAAYCPRQLYYRRRTDGGDGAAPPPVRARQALAFRYPALLADDDVLAEAPTAVPDTTVRARLGAARARLADWGRLVDPAGRGVHLSGRDCRGVADKVLETSPPTPSIVFGGAPPSDGVWHPHRVRVVAAAKALAWERERRVERGFAEYPAHGVIRTVPVDGRRAEEYRTALRRAAPMVDPPPRVANRAKCTSCDYRQRCGVRTRSAGTLLG